MSSSSSKGSVSSRTEPTEPKEPGAAEYEEGDDREDQIVEISSENADELWYRSADDKVLNKEQELAIKRTVKKNVSIVTGGAGMGKTFMIAALVRLWLASTRDYGTTVLLLAPTGKATQMLQMLNFRNVRQRVIEDAEEKDESPPEPLKRVICSTVAMMNAATWLHEQLKRKCFVLIDEASMLTVEALDRLLERVKPMNLVFVGDVNQLPPPNGSDQMTLLETLIADRRIKTTILTESYRFADKTAALFHNVKNFFSFKSWKELKTDNTSFGIMTGVVTHDDFVNVAIGVCRRLPEKESVQFICMGNELRKRLNLEVKHELNPTGHVAANLGLGDVVVCLKNLYVDKVLKVSNGTRGVVAFNEKSNIIKYENGFVDVQDTHTKKFASKFELGYVITGHKSQGDEFDNVVVLCEQGEQTADLRWLYTVITRARKKLLLLGAAPTFDNFFGFRRPRNSTFITILDEAFEEREDDDEDEEDEDEESGEEDDDGENESDENDPEFTQKYGAVKEREDDEDEEE